MFRRLEESMICDTISEIYHADINIMFRRLEESMIPISEIYHAYINIMLWRLEESMIRDTNITDLLCWYHHHVPETGGINDS
ncbi:hypothetical protein RRG08_021464 [Elysia crispata]|uniref:Uncharacterized protein n=1 Tax=Elysia crispata TaxID=231223 RepID=A0AAE1AFI9_9GAST|nr:hypothetical protein RRG08_021464 [Elysia crispata]